MCISNFPITLLHKNVTEMILGSSQFISDIILIIWLRGCLPGFRIIIHNLFSFFFHIQSIISSCSLYYLKMCWIHLLFFWFWSSLTGLHCPKYVIICSGSPFLTVLVFWSPLFLLISAQTLLSPGSLAWPPRTAQVPYFTFSQHCVPFLHRIFYCGK